MRTHPIDELPDAPHYLVEGSDARHMIRVLRVRVGEAWVLQDRRGERQLAAVASTTRDNVTFELGERLPPFPRKRTPVWLACSPPRGTRLGDLVRGVVEGGVDRIVPLVCERSVAGRGPNLVERIARSAHEAVKQSGRPPLEAILEGLTPFDLDQLENHRRLVLQPRRDRTGLVWPRELEQTPEDAPWLLVVGPEGGFTDGELAGMAGERTQRVSIGPQIYRIETAATVATSIATGWLHGDHSQPCSANET